MNAVQLNMLVGGVSATPPPSASEEVDWITTAILLPGDTNQQASGPSASAPDPSLSISRGPIRPR